MDLRVDSDMMNTDKTNRRNPHRPGGRRVSGLEWKCAVGLVELGYWDRIKTLHRRIEDDFIF